MTPELRYLVWSAVLALALALLSPFAAALQLGLPAMTGNRESLPEVTGWAGRARRAHRNMLEYLVIFAILVLVAYAVGVRNSMTLLGAQLFFWGRVAHAAVYIAGIPWLRTAVWAVSVAGLLLIVRQLVGWSDLPALLAGYFGSDVRLAPHLRS